MSENVGYVVAYDLPSENISVLSKEQKQKVRNVRVRSVQLLHSLGVQCTESVILVAPSRIPSIQETINKVHSLYSTLDFLDVTPLIEVIPLYQNQFEQFRELASRRILEIIDSTIERLSNLLDEIDSIIEHSVLNRIRYNLNRTRNNIVQLQEFARELDISRDRDFDYLISLIDQAIERTRRD